MYRYIRVLGILGVVVIFVFSGSTLTDQGKAQADPFSFDFTFTSDETVKVVPVWDTVAFHAVLTNTGTEADSYLVTLIENPPTPEEWWVRACAGGRCWDSTETTKVIWSGEAPGPLEPGWADSSMELDVIPRTAGRGDFTMTVESLSNPGAKLTKSITFLLNYVPGDASGDGIVDLGDLLFLVSYLYKGGSAPTPMAAGDPTGDCVVDLGDILYLVSYLYKGGAAPEPGCA